MQLKSLILFFSGIFLLNIVSKAQITITDSDMPMAGDTFRLSIGSDMQAYDPALTGANYTWNFDTLQTDAQRVDTFKSISNTPVAYQFVFYQASYGLLVPSPSSGSSQFQFENVHNFYKNSSSEYILMGFGAEVNGQPIPVKYDSVDRHYKFPLNYLDTDSSYAEYGFSVPNQGYYGQEIVRIDTVDGWGTLITPFGTFQTLRVKSTVDRTDTIYYDSFGYGTKVNRPREIEYKWLAAGEGIPVLSVTERTGTGTYSIAYRDSMREDVYQVSVEKHVGSQTQVKVYPNPASEMLTVEVKSIEAGNYALAILDVSGKRIISRSLELKEGRQQVNISLTEIMQGGVYFLRLVNQEGNTEIIRKITVTK